MTNRIPIENLEGFVRDFEKVEKNLPYPTKIQLDWCFEIFNNYVALSHKKEENKNCPACRIRVIGTLRQIANKWKTTNIL